MVESSAATPSYKSVFKNHRTKSHTNLILTVDERLVLVQAVVAQMEFTIRGLRGAVTVGKVVNNDLDELLLARSPLGSQSFIDQPLEVRNL